MVKFPRNISISWCKCIVQHEPTVQWAKSRPFSSPDASSAAAGRHRREGGTSSPSSEESGLRRGARLEEKDGPCVRITHGWNSRIRSLERAGGGAASRSPPIVRAERPLFRDEEYQVSWFLALSFSLLLCFSYAACVGTV